MTDEQIKKVEKLFAMLGPTQALCVNPPEGGSVAAQINADGELATVDQRDGKLKKIKIQSECPASHQQESGFRVEDRMLYLNGSLIGEIIEGTVVDGQPFRFRHISDNRYLNGKIQEARWVKDEAAFVSNPADLDDF